MGLWCNVAFESISISTLLLTHLTIPSQLLKTFGLHLVGQPLWCAPFCSTLFAHFDLLPFRFCFDNFLSVSVCMLYIFYLYILLFSNFLSFITNHNISTNFIFCIPQIWKKNRNIYYVYVFSQALMPLLVNVLNLSYIRRLCFIKHTTDKGIFLSFNSVRVERTC